LGDPRDEGLNATAVPSIRCRSLGLPFAALPTVFTWYPDPRIMRTILLLPALFAALFASAQTGVNSDCAHAIALPVSPTNVQVVFTPADGRVLPTAVPDPVTACSGSGNNGSAWFSFVATASTHWIRTEGDDLDESSLEVFSGTCGALTSVVCGASNGPTPVATGLVPGNTYFLRVIMPQSAFCFTGTCQVWVAVVSAPTNDDCSGAIELPVTSGTAQVDPATEISTLGATQSQAACTGDASAANDDVWYRFTATHSAHFFATSKLSGDDLKVQWFSGACGSLASIGCDVVQQTGLTPGQEYHIRVHSVSTVPTVSSRAVAGVFAPALNDECSGALPVTVAHSGEQPVPVLISTANCTSSTVPCDTRPHDVWLSFTAPTSSVSVVCSEYQWGSLFSGSCGSLTCVLNGPLSPAAVFDGLTVGGTYYLKIGTNASPTNSTVWVFAAPSNDECADAVELPVQGANANYTAGYSYGATQSQPANCGGASDVWYRFTATGTRAAVDVLRAVTPNMLYVEVLGGACGALTSLVCQQALTDPALVTGLTPGSTYYVRILPNSNSNPVGFRIAVRDGVPNDDCDGAIQLPFLQLADYDAVTPLNNTQANDGTGTCDAHRDLWYRFTAAHTSAAFIAPGISGSGTGLELLSGTCGALTSIACLPDLTFTRGRFGGLAVGTEYHIRLSSAATTNFRPLLFDQNVNDNIAGAVDAPVGGSVFAEPLFEQVNYPATQSLGPLCNSGAHPDEDTWFHFVATATTHTIIAHQQSLHYNEPDIIGPYLHIEAFDTLSADSTTLAANVVGCADSPLALSGLIVGHDYWYRTYTVNVGPAQICAFTTGVSTGNNDEANGAMSLTYGTAYSATFNTTGATQSMPGADCSVDDVADDDIWFKFVATTSPARIVVGYHTTDVALELFSGTPGNLTSIACSDNILVLPTLTAGQTYYARLYSWANATPAMGRIGLFITPSLTANTCVEETCLGPVLLQNPSIEQGDNCLVLVTDIAATDGLGTLAAPGWPRMQGGSCDGHSSCAGYNSFNEVPNAGYVVTPDRVLSRSGRGMGGIYLKDQGGSDYYEYLQATLTEPLVPGEPYLVSFHAANLPGGYLCVNGLGAALSVGPLATLGYTQPVAFEPQVESEQVICGSEWVNICGVVVPNEPVDHITIGTFRSQGEFQLIGNQANPSYYFIDDVVVAHVTDPGCVTGIGDVPPMDENSNGDEGDDLRIYPNPANDRVTMMLDASMSGQRGVIEVFDVTGKRVHAQEVSSLNALQRLDLSSEWREGLYLVVVKVEGQEPRNARVVVKR
jgi:hypothetical protein